MNRQDAVDAENRTEIGNVNRQGAHDAKVERDLRSEREANRQGAHDAKVEQDSRFTRDVNRQGVHDAKVEQGSRFKSAKRDGAHRLEPDRELDRLAAAVVDSAVEVHRALGPGLLESTYEQALSVELVLLGLPHVSQAPIALTYKGHAVGQARLDLLVADRLVVELKACEALMPIHVAQLLAYLKIADLSLGLLVNLNVPLLRQGVRRVIRSH
jgi:GxxExxY protein